jgi:transposase-like protein
MDTDFAATYERIHTWAYETAGEILPTITYPARQTVYIRNVKEVTNDMLRNPEKYIIILKKPRCSICGNPGHNSRKHTKNVTP